MQGTLHNVQVPNTQGYYVRLLDTFTEMPVLDLNRQSLEGEQQQEGHHQTEETHSLGEGETQDSVGEQLLLQTWVPGISNNEGTEHGSNTSS